MQNFSQAHHTIIVSDIHLADAEPLHPKRPLWKRFKRPKLFVDRQFKAFLEHVQEDIAPKLKTSGSAQSKDPIELILNGDIFDFDSVMVIPDDLKMSVNWLEKARGLAPEENKSRFKMKVILSDHSLWLEAIRNFVLAGNRVVFVIGNHDMELHWPSVRQDVIDRMDLPQELRENVRFCEWFYISNGDTLIEHGNQYDAYCLCMNPVNPLIKKGSKVMLRLPFGNLAGKYMLNGMGLMNPHVDGSYIKGSVAEYIVFFYRYIMRVQPFILLTWFWSAAATLFVSLSEGALPAMMDPLTVDQRVDEIAARANSTSRVVWMLKELRVHPGVFDPIKVARELWLDRAVFLLFVFFISYEFFTFLHITAGVNLWGFLTPIALLLPIFVFYARSVESDMQKIVRVTYQMAPLSAKIAKVKRVVHGHTHLEKHMDLEGIEYLNTGTWSPAFKDVECTQPFGRKCFAWIHPVSEGSSERVAELFEWKDGIAERISRS